MSSTPSSSPEVQSSPAPQINPTPTSSPSLKLLERSFRIGSALYCAPEAENPPVAAPYDLVVSPDGQDIYWVGQKEVEQQGKDYFQARRYLYHLRLGTEPTRVKAESKYPLDCTMGEELERDSQGNLYVTRPLEHEIYKINPQTQTLERIVRDTDLSSQVVTMTTIVQNEDGVWETRNKQIPLTGPHQLFVTQENEILYNMSARSEVISDYRVRNNNKEVWKPFTQPEPGFPPLYFASFAPMIDIDFRNEQNDTFSPSHFTQNSSGQIFSNDATKHQIWILEIPNHPNLDLAKPAPKLDFHESTGQLHAGTGVPGLQDGPRLEAQFNQPHGLAFDAAGNLYVADTGNAAIRKITPEGVVSTLYQRKAVAR